MSQTVGRAIEILEFCSQQPRKVGQVAEQLGVHRTTALRLVQTLAEAGFLRKAPDGSYGAGLRLVGLAREALKQSSFLSVVHPYLVELSNGLGFTVQFAVPEGGTIVYADKIEPPNAITLNTIIGGTVVLHTAGVSKAILANLPLGRQDAILRKATFERHTENTITSREAFDIVLSKVRREGWAYDSGEYELFSNCIAAPVWDHSGEVAGAVSITAFREVADVDALLAYLPALLEKTTAISRELGWRRERTPLE